MKTDLVRQFERMGHKMSIKPCSKCGMYHRQVRASKAYRRIDQ